MTQTTSQEARIFRRNRSSRQSHRTQTILYQKLGRVGGGFWASWSYRVLVQWYLIGEQSRILRVAWQMLVILHESSSQNLAMLRHVINAAILAAVSHCRLRCTSNTLDYVMDHAGMKFSCGNILSSHYFLPCWLAPVETQGTRVQ